MKPKTSPPFLRHLLLVAAALLLAGPARAAAADTSAPATNAGPAVTLVTLDARSPGRVFEGVGALSAGASSRLLLNYPDAYRSRILDYLFKPGFGASLQHLKVELGGDVNSTDGTEPSHARTRAEFEEPRAEYFARGYEWWLMREARRRNPDIKLDVLQWGAPGWIGGAGDERARFYSQDNANFIAAFLRAGRRIHSLEIDYCGIWNETAHDAAWIKLLRRTLDRSGLRDVQIVAADETGDGAWKIAGEMLADPELMNSVNVVGAHYPRGKTTADALSTGKALWASEDGPWRGDWPGAQAIGRSLNHNYLEGRMTKTIFWSLVTSYYDVLPLPNSGLMSAKEPWSGHFDPLPALWAVAHTTQFARPGWRYADDACLPLAGGGSCVTLRGPRKDGDFSVILETGGATGPQAMTLLVGEGFSKRRLHVWRSTKARQFERLPDLAKVGGSYALTLDPDAIYSLTSTSDQRKGESSSPAAAAFPLPYADDFEDPKVGQYARFFSDQGGVFEVAERPDGGQCLRQVVPRPGIDWQGHRTPEPYTLIGSAQWRNYEVGVDACIEDSGYASVGGRVSASLQSALPPVGYRFEVTADGKWRLCSHTNLLAQGRVKVNAGEWHNLTLRLSGSRVTGLVDGQEAGSVFDSACRRGMAALGTGWNCARFDNFTIHPIEGPDSPNLALGKTASASSLWDAHYPASAAVDGHSSTRWNAQAGKAVDEWLAVDLGAPVRFNSLHIVQFARRITRYRIEVGNDGKWEEVLTGRCAGRDEWAVTFPEVQASQVRLVVLEVDGEPAKNPPSISEFEVYRE